MINYQIKKAPDPVIKAPTNINVRRALRIEVPGYSGASITLDGRVCVDGTIFNRLKHKDYRVEILLRNGSLQPTLDDITVPTEPSYTYAPLTTVITFSANYDFVIPAGDNLIIILR